MSVFLQKKKRCHCLAKWARSEFYSETHFQKNILKNGGYLKQLKLFPI